MTVKSWFLNIYMCMGVCLLAQAPEPSREQTHIADNGYNWHHYMVSTYHSSLKKKKTKKNQSYWSSHAWDRENIKWVWIY